jgi:hypothetical protein
MGLQSGDLSLLSTEAFTILSDSDRPTLISISPEAMEQGESATVCIELNSPLEGDALQVDLGEGIYVESMLSQDTRVWVDVVVDHDAPLGLHDVIVDDGIRIREGVRLRIRDRREPVQKICASLAGSQPRPDWLVIPCLFLILRRRKMSAPQGTLS